MSEPDAQATPLLVIDGVDAFYGRAQVLEGVSFSMGTEAIAVIGRNGMGKTTLCNAIMGIAPPAVRGSARFRGTELVGKPSNKIAGAGVRHTSRREGGSSRHSPRTSTSG